MPNSTDKHAGQRLRAGAASIDITPSLGIPLTGYVAREGTSRGVHDPLSARALVLDDGDTRVALVVCDLVGLPESTIAAARQGIGAAVNLPPSAVMMACTHTHSGPATLFLHECGEVDPEYLASLPPRLTEVAQCAATRLAPAEVSVTGGTVPDGMYNRRGDGSPVDAEVGAAWLRDAEGNTVAALVNYGCHPVTLTADNNLISADYPGYLRRALEEELGGTAFFLTGASGNVDPRRRGSFEDARWLGQRLTQEALAVLRDASPSANADIDYAVRPLTLPVQLHPDPADLRQRIEEHRRGLAAAENADLSLEAKIQRAMLAWAASTLRHIERGSARTAMAAEVQVIRIGPLILVGVPGELFSGLGQRIKQCRPPDTHIFVVGYANGDIGYIPDQAAYDFGGYEVNDAYKYYGHPAPLDSQAGEQIVTAACTLIASGSDV